MSCSLRLPSSSRTLGTYITFCFRKYFLTCHILTSSSLAPQMLSSEANKHDIRQTPTVGGTSLQTNSATIRRTWNRLKSSPVQDREATLYFPPPSPTLVWWPEKPRATQNEKNSRNAFYRNKAITRSDVMAHLPHVSTNRRQAPPSSNHRTTPTNSPRFVIITHLLQIVAGKQPNVL